ncbi:MAG TPA: sensor domain-containing diguanylate cyclase, partial [Candidatus Omnitrophota bacterium]|nr:sensor domain-containing diguanylate cyclase [Candidatus Omnitrophota bacterium]
DYWVLRHNQPLLVESTISDFRFDPEMVKQQLSRPVNSLICVPLITDTNVLGVLRVDSGFSEAYNSDDLRFLAHIGDISKLSLENAIYFGHMQALSITDGLTGIFLRRHALDRLKDEYLRAQRSKSSLSFLMLDLDHFKELNDIYGHLAGDSVLKKIAKALKETFDFPGNVVARYGGEEFCVILPYVEKKEAIRLAESFRASIAEKEIAIRRQRVKATVSIGVASFPDDIEVFEDLIRRSDDALLKAKRTGRNKVCSF